MAEENHACAIKEYILETNTLAGKAGCREIVMGCMTSVILFKGIRTVIERNCSYICKHQRENKALEYTANSLTKEDSGILIHSFLVNVDVLH